MIYLDNAATTACAPEVLDAMLPFFREHFANASSIDHQPGNEAKTAVEKARAAVAALVHARPEDVIFTSGSTEANNLALSMNAFRVFTTAIEHPSILDPFAARASDGDGLLPVDARGIVDIDALETRLGEGMETLVSIIATNNETGVEQNIEEIARTVAAAKGLLHVDGTQAVGTRDIDVTLQGLVGVSISAHKIHGPKGVGALVATGPLRRGLRAIQRGGGHERGLRSGTLNVPGIVGFGVAAQLALQERAGRRARLMALRAEFLDVLRGALGEQVQETVRDAPVSPHILSLRFTGTNGRALLRALREEVAFSLGSACATNRAEPSHVLLAMGLDKHAIAQTLRFSFAADQDLNAVREAATLIVEAVGSLSNYSLTA